MSEKTTIAEQLATALAPTPARPRAHSPAATASTRASSVLTRFLIS